MKFLLKQPIEVSRAFQTIGIYMANPKNIDAIIELQKNAKYPIYCTIKQERPKRSLAQNRFLWYMLSEIAMQNGTSDMETYLYMLRRYSSKEYMQVRASAFPTMKRLFRIIDVVEENDKSVKFFYWLGSSDFDTKEMTRLLDGIKSEANEMGIVLMTYDEYVGL